MAPDEKEAMAIYVKDGDYWVGVVSSTVFAIGYDSEFIIAKQHPRTFPNHPNKSIVNYFIIPLKLKVEISLDENKIGPLSKKEFEIKRRELRISSHLRFTKTFKDLE